MTNLSQKIGLLILCVIIGCFIVLMGIFFMQSKQPVITSLAGQVSPGTYVYLSHFFDEYKNDPDKLFRYIQSSEAKGILATRLGLNQDPSYFKYYSIAKRNRARKIATLYWKEKIGIHFSKTDVLRFYQISIDMNHAVDQIIQHIERKGSDIHITQADFDIGVWDNRPIKLQMIKNILFIDEWKQFISFSAETMRDILPIYVQYWLQNIADQEFIHATKAIPEEISRFDHNQVADRFLIAKYGMAGDGIYPTPCISISFTPKELFEHFHRIKKRFTKDFPDEKTQYNQYKDAVLLDLTNKILRKQYPIDIQDTIDRLNFKMDKNNIPMEAIKSP